MAPASRASWRESTASAQRTGVRTPAAVATTAVAATTAPAHRHLTIALMFQMIIIITRPSCTMALVGKIARQTVMEQINIRFWILPEHTSIPRLWKEERVVVL